MPQKIVAGTILFETIDGFLSIEYWIGLRRDQRLSAATAILRLAVEKLTAHG